MESGNQHFLLDVNSTLFLDSAAPEAAAVPGAEEAKDGAPAPPPPPVNAPPVRRHVRLRWQKKGGDD